MKSVTIHFVYAYVRAYINALQILSERFRSHTNASVNQNSPLHDLAKAFKVCDLSWQRMQEEEKEFLRRRGYEESRNGGRIWM
jgi:hypothetical protein